MKIRFMFHTSVTLMTILMLSIPFVALARQQPEQPEVPKPKATQDTNALILQAKINAERDANNDINKVSWFLAGNTPFIGAAAGALGGCYIGSTIDPINSLSWIPAPSDGMVIGACIGGAVLSLVPLFAIGVDIKNYQPTNLPPERFIGKSPEYVEFYTEFYKEETQRLRKKWALIGGGTVSACCLFSILIP